MDRNRLDALAMRFAAGGSRRALFRGLGVAALGAIAAATGFGETAAAHKRSVGNACAVNADCASNLCVREGRTRKICHCGGPSDCPPATGGSCHVAVCAAGRCTIGINTGAVCDDGDPCTVQDACQPDGSCKGAPKDCSNFSDQCHVGACRAADGVCIGVPANQGAPCTGSVPCTVGTTCQTGGSCGGGQPKDCSSLNDQCHAGVCRAADGVCVADPANQGSACTGSDPCTVNTTCQADGACGGGQPKDCSSLTAGCLIGVCNSTSGSCEAVEAPAGTACTGGDGCIAGACCPANRRCRDPFDVNNPTATRNPVCCPSGQSCQSETVSSSGGAVELDICCDDGAAACAMFGPPADPLSYVCCAGGQTCAGTQSPTSNSPIDYGVCCDAGLAGCLTPGPGGTFSSVCCGSGQSCLIIPPPAGLTAPLDIGLCCDAGASACSQLEASGGGFSVTEVCCASGQACVDVGNAASTALNVPGSRCCDTGADACLVGIASGNPAPVCCAAGQTCQPVGQAGVVLDNLCCDRAACNILTTLGGAIAPTCCPANTACQSLLPFADCCAIGTTFTFVFSGDAGTVTGGVCCPAGQLCTPPGLLPRCCNPGQFCGGAGCV